MLKAYFDDSSSENADGAHRSVFVLAGFMSTAERWAVFDEEWNEVLNDLKRKRGGPKRLKMSQAMSARSRGPINRAVWDPRFAKIEAIIARHAEVGFGCIIDLDAFKEVRRCDPMIDAIKSAYRVAFLGIIGATVRYHCEQGITDKVDFVFDDQGADFDRAYDCFQHVRRTDPYLTN